jgi:hypothetical protein
MHPHIDPHRFPGRWKRLLFDFTGKTGRPFSRLPAEADRLDLAFEGTMPPHPDPPNPAELQPPPIHLEAVPVFLQPKAVEAVLALESGMPGRFPGLHPPEEGAKSLVQVLHHHLKDVAVELPGVFVFFPILLYLPQLLEFPNPAMLLLPGILALGQADDWLVPISVLPYFRTIGDYMVTRRNLKVFITSIRTMIPYPFQEDNPSLTPRPPFIRPFKEAVFCRFLL